MSTTRIIAISTSNPIKVSEIKWDFAPYGIDVVQIPWPFSIADYDKFFSTQILAGKKVKPMCIIREETELVRPNNIEPINTNQLTQLEEVIHSSTVLITSPEMSETKIYNNKVYGYIDFTRKTNDPEVYDWDDIFVVSDCNKTYWELKKLNHKYSARDKCISQYIRDSIYYKSNVDLKHYPQNYTNCVDFTKDPAKFIQSVPEFSNELAIKLKLSNIPINALNNGMFFRSAINRRQKLYWCPGLNAGIPFVPKPKDPKHELTFMFHDFSHFAIPDLVFDGIHNQLAQKVYIGYRLMSEAMTLVLGDMLFVYSMISTGFEYQTVQARKIYPVFALLKDKLFNDSISVTESMRILLEGSYNYCFYGSMDLWKNYMDLTNEETEYVLKDFSNKYDAYFLEDFRWTNLNYNYMKDNKSHYTEWWKENSPIVKAHGIQLYSVSEWIQMFQLDKVGDVKELNKIIFDSVYSTYIEPLITKTIELNSKEQRLKNMFVRYIIGQSQIFFKYDSIYSESMNYWSTIKNTLNYLVNNEITDQIISNTRKYYNKYLTKLLDKTMISDDDYNTYKDIYPIFKPFIVDYDGLQESRTLAEFSELMLCGST